MLFTLDKQRGRFKACHPSNTKTFLKEKVLVALDLLLFNSLTTTKSTLLLLGSSKHISKDWKTRLNCWFFYH